MIVLHCRVRIVPVYFCPALEDICVVLFILFNNVVRCVVGGLDKIYYNICFRVKYTTWFSGFFLPLGCRNVDRMGQYAV